MPERHRILIVDDDAHDRTAVVRALRREAAHLDGVEADVLEVDTVARAREAIHAEEFACVFLDHSLPDGTSLDLLIELRGQGLSTPIVVLTGERDEETIMEVMKAGAVDYLPKKRLHPDLVVRSLRAALRFQQSQREKQAILEELRARDRAVAAATNGIVLADPRLPDCPLVYVNDAFLKMTGYAREEVLERNCRFLQGPETDPAAVRELGEAIRAKRPCQVSILNYRKDGTPFWNEVTVSPVRDDAGRLTHFVGIQTDMSDRREAEAERDRLAERERNIARQLQAALTPAIPERIAGMALRKHYEAALEEAGVGGDFYDVFPVDKGCTALVVGDLSGKGLAAASQVAMVRNMLRYALYRAHTLAGGMESLNTLLAEQGLLVGFATLFVGAFNSAASTLTYVNAGQEPALVRRAATGEVEHLTPTGMILGFDENAQYTEQVVTLERGDALAVFSDGLTEVGPSRLDMLGIEGVTALFEQPLEEADPRNAAAIAERLALRLIAGVDAAAQGGVMRDDVCLLIAVAE